MDLTYREYGGWFSANIEIKVQGDQIIVGDRLPQKLTPAEVTGLITLAQHILDAEDQFTPHVGGVADANFIELEIYFGSGSSKRFVVRPPFDVAPPAFTQLSQELSALWRAAARERLQR